MTKIWKIKNLNDAESHEDLKEYPLLLRQLLLSRKIFSKQEAENFLNPQYQGLHSPFLFKDMEKAVERIWQAIENKEKITIYGDYDADAVTANAVLQQMFNFLNFTVSSYIPDRFSEGYGINMEALAKIKQEGNSIIITVDCGTNSLDAVEFCEKNDIDLIITDHHEITGEIPKPFALINPKNPEDNYPYQSITGVGVAFKLACAILSKHEKVNKIISSKANRTSENEYVGGWEKWLLDLVAIGTVADCHSLIGENRILVKYGLQVLKKTKWPGLKAISQTSGLDFSQKTPDTYALGFVIAPRLNAAGRLEHANIALDVLLEKNEILALEKAANLEKVNTKRQTITEIILSEAREQAEMLKDRKILVLNKQGWSKGVVGLVAGKIADEFNKPTIVLANEDGALTGSARTVGEFDILSAIKNAEKYLDRYGGHKQAAGLSLKIESLENFYVSILEFAENNIPENGFEKEIILESEIQKEHLSLHFSKLIADLEPFGVDNQKPKFALKNVKIIDIKNVGKTQKHVQIRLDKEAKQISSIGFNMSNQIKAYKIGDFVDVACELFQTLGMVKKM